MTEKKANFVPVSALDKRPRSKRDLLRGLVRQAPFVAKNFQLYFRNAWRRNILRTKVVAPYAVTFYVTHKCNLACSYCTQKEPDVFSDELPTRETIALLKRIRKETDSIVFTGGEPTLRTDIEELVEAARFECKYRSLLLITNGTLLDRKPRILRAVTGLVVSLDALAADLILLGDVFNRDLPFGRRRRGRDGLGCGKDAGHVTVRSGWGRPG